jgi:hypothetical protein
MKAFAAEWIAAFDTLDLERILSHFRDPSRKQPGMRT